MVLPLSTPGSCCGHNLNMHSGNGLEGTCLVCSCVGFVPDMEDQMAKMISGPQCQARYVWEDRDAPPLQCELDRGHLGEQDHKHGDIRWTDTIAHYPDVHEVLKTLRDSVRVTAPGTARDSQVGGDHYAKHKIQHWDIVEEYGLNYFEGAVVKYVLRHRDKNGVQDLKKARHTLDRLIEIEEARSAERTGDQ